jgi:hypothetical protein
MENTPFLNVVLLFLSSIGAIGKDFSKEANPHIATRFTGLLHVRGEFELVSQESLKMNGKALLFRTWTNDGRGTS